MLDRARERIDLKPANGAIAAAKSISYRLLDARRLERVRNRPWTDDGQVSVIIPTYRRRDLLMERALPSVLAQTHRNLQVIVAVHGDSDDTARVVREVPDPRIVVLEVPRKRLAYPNKAEYHWLVGPTRPINAGLDAVCGSWIARIDDDDVWKPEHLQTSLEFARSGDFEFVSSTYLTSTDAGTRIVGREGDPVGGVQTWVYRSYLRLFRANIDAWRKSWNRVNDTDIQDRMSTAGVRFGFRDDPDPKVVITPRPGELHIGSAAYLADPLRVERDMKK
jgi:glycosyltransferase involved in cell wall biosynthesis